MNTVLSPSACPGFHNDSWRRAEVARLADGIPHELTPRAGNPVWCDSCAQRQWYALAALPDLASKLLIESKNATSAGAEHVSGSKERRLHEAEKYYRCIDDIAELLAYWAEAIREDRNLAPSPPRRRVGTVITVDARLLLIHFDWMMAEHPEPAQSTEFGNDINRLHRHATRLTHTDEVRAEHCDGVVCHKCDLMALEHEIDGEGRATGYVACLNCGDLQSTEEYERWVKMLAAPLRKSVAA